MSDLLSALLLGILEGLTEFLPISSTGHLLIAQHWLGARSDFFNIVIQAGAIVAVVLVFRQRLLQLATGFNQRENREYVFKLGAAFLVTAVVGLVVQGRLVAAGDGQPGGLGIDHRWCLDAAGGGLHRAPARPRPGDLDGGDRRGPGTGSGRRVPRHLALGLGDLPGHAAGPEPRAAAAEFVFLVGIPTMFAASAYTFLEMAKAGQLGSEDWADVGVALPRPSPASS